MVHFPKTPEERRAYDAQLTRAADRARAALKPGDRIRVTRCGGAAPIYTFDGWATNYGANTTTETSRWMRSISGVDDLSPFCLIAVNGEPTSFRDDPAEHLADPYEQNVRDLP